MNERRVLVVGGGVFGVTAAIELARRGCRVALLDAGAIPHPFAESTDISKIVRMDYGADEDYTALMEVALEGWARWNEKLAAPLYHPVGVAFLCREEMAAGGFELESYRLLSRRGHALLRLGSSEIARRYPAWNASRYVDGYFNANGGYAESGRVVAALCAEARALGVEVREGCRGVTLVEGDARVAGMLDQRGELHAADQVVVAAGSWTAEVLPSLKEQLRPVGQPVFHLRPADPSLFRAECFPVFGADISRTGYYGFCVNRDGLVKVANHGPGRAVDPSSARERTVSPAEEAALREFLRDTFPSLESAPIAERRICVYGDTRDEHFFIARDPEREGLVVAAGGSGHGFKFAPLLGGLIADAADGVDRPILEKFRYRKETAQITGAEAARHRG